MNTVSLQIEAMEGDAVADVQTITGAVELGRQNESSEPLYSSRSLQAAEVQSILDRFPKIRASLSGRLTRYVIASMSEDVVSRHHALVSITEDHRISVTNLSQHVMVRIGKQTDVSPGKSVLTDPPVRLTLGTVQGGRVVRLAVSLPIRGQSMRLEPPQESDAGLIRKLEPLQTTNFNPDASATIPVQLVGNDPTAMEEVIRWLHGALGVLQAATSSSDFFQRAAQSVVDDVKCDRGAVLLLREDAWFVEAFSSSIRAKPKPDWRPSGSFLAYVLRENRTCWQTLDGSTPTGSLSMIEMVVGAPIRDQEGKILGVLYGECDLDKSKSLRTRMTRLEATLAEILAGSVANGLARIHQQKVALAAEVRFDQFFTPELSQELARNPNLLEGRDREVTLLFADIRGFSHQSEKLGPAVTMEWIGDIMNELSDCVLKESGVLVDYLGDELMAMWGAPTDQPDHPVRASRAALAMLSCLPKLNERWSSRLDEPIRLGIGINTGTARVGNTGSRFKFKYGPLGHMVNLAARLQGATKYLRVPILLSESTATKLHDGFLTRRLCSVRVVNIQKPVSLYELSYPDQTEWSHRCKTYDEALRLFEEASQMPEDVQRLSMHLRTAAKQLGNLLSDCPDDGPAMVLLARVVNVLADENAPFNLVWDLPGK
jgi:adenylate cyclase